MAFASRFLSAAKAANGDKLQCTIANTLRIQPMWLLVHAL
jgi:hypothetical protein